MVVYSDARVLRRAPSAYRSLSSPASRCKLCTLPPIPDNILTTALQVTNPPSFFLIFSQLHPRATPRITAWNLATSGTRTTTTYQVSTAVIHRPYTDLWRSSCFPAALGAILNRLTPLTVSSGLRYGYHKTATSQHHPGILC